MFYINVKKAIMFGIWEFETFLIPYYFLPANRLGRFFLKINTNNNNNNNLLTIFSKKKNYKK